MGSPLPSSGHVHHPFRPGLASRPQIPAPSRECQGKVTAGSCAHSNVSPPPCPGAGGQGRVNQQVGWEPLCCEPEASPQLP